MRDFLEPPSGASTEICIGMLRFVFYDHTYECGRRK